MLCRPYGADLLDFTFPTGVDTPAYSVSPYGLIINPHSVFYSFIPYSISSFRAPSPHPGLDPGSQPIFPQQIADQVRDGVSKSAMSALQRCFFLVSKVLFTAHKGTLFLWQRWLIAVPTVLNPSFNALFVKYFILKILYKLANSSHFIGGFADTFPSALANYEMMVFRVSWSVSWQKDRLKLCNHL